MGCCYSVDVLLLLCGVALTCCQLEHLWAHLQGEGNNIEMGMPVRYSFPTYVHLLHDHCVHLLHVHCVHLLHVHCVQIRDYRQLLSPDCQVEEKMATLLDAGFSQEQVDKLIVQYQSILALNSEEEFLPRLK